MESKWAILYTFESYREFNDDERTAVLSPEYKTLEYNRSFGLKQKWEG